MSEKSNKFAEALDELITEGEMLQNAIQYECRREAFRETAIKSLGEEEAEDFIKLLPSFTAKYQAWYSEAHGSVKQLLPDRLADFQSYYEDPRVRKEITFQNYKIKDCLQGLKRTQWDGSVIVDKSAAIPQFDQQLNIVKAAKSTLDSVLINLKIILQADLFDSEIDSARALGKAGYLRAAGAICGVVIEKHLLRICDAHSITIRKKNPGISDLNQSLRDNDVITVPQWRFNQHLADVRNVCDHAKGKEPTSDEIDDLIQGTDKILKTIF